ncbi:hypothetical protein [Yoonia sp. 208BN28-4]|uniref:hypothetical protein n=1 Tax=Yoonia sp. 208BN28-4 TaxID=3126505 RepID=UPI0030A1174F
MWRASLALMMACALPACAQDYVRTDGQLSDNDFYRLVACGAAPGGRCDFDIIRWAPEDAASLSFAIAPFPEDYPRRLAERLPDALDQAIVAINDAGADLQVVRTNKLTAADVVIYPRNWQAGDRMTGLPRAQVNGTRIGAAHVHVWWGGDNYIDDALIVMGATIENDEVFPILLEEMTQSLGPLTDIKNPWYNNRSVFAEDSNTVMKLGAQDRMVLRRLYGS